MKKALSLIIITALCAFMFCACGKEETGELLTGLHHVKMAVENYGTIELELDADNAPITVTNFIDLAKSGFYDGLSFHRVASQSTMHIIQGGDPEGTGLGGSEKTIKGEFTANGVANNLTHKRGAISMARTSEMDSASSQFFICQSDFVSGNGKYAVFGYVTSGMGVVDAIYADCLSKGDANGTLAPADQPKITQVTVVD